MLEQLIYELMLDASMVFMKITFLLLMCTIGAFFFRQKTITKARIKIAEIVRN